MVGSLAIAWGRATSGDSTQTCWICSLQAEVLKRPNLRAPTISGLSAGVRESEADLGSRHICLFFGRHEERWEAFRPFFLKHFYAGKPTIYIHSASTREEIMDRVHDEGLDPNEVSRRGLLTLIPARDAYLKNQTFTPELAERSVAKLTPAKTIALGDDLDPPAVHCSRFGRTAQRRGRVTARQRGS